ncbi:MAG: hypothetical protein ABI614_27030, partial [Planctomycetota bacterium]
INSIDDDALTVILSEQAASAEVKAITQEQRRIRDNMGELDRNSELYMRYVSKLDAQETVIEELRPKLAELIEKEQQAKELIGIE